MDVRSGLLAAALFLGASCTVRAQSAAVFAPAQPPEMKGRIAQFLLASGGDVEGVLLADGTEVFTPPLLSTQIAFLLKPGDAVTIHGLRAKAIDMVLADSITNDSTNTTLRGRWLDMRGEHAATPPLSATGQVRWQLHSAHGDLDGVALSDGTIVSLPSPEAERLADVLAPGRVLYTSGPGSKNLLGTVIAAEVLGVDREHAQIVAEPRPPRNEERPQEMTIREIWP